MPSLLYIILSFVCLAILGGLKLSSWYCSPKQQVRRATKKVNKAKIALLYSLDKCEKANETLYKLIKDLGVSKHVSKLDMANLTDVPADSDTADK